ncbi:type VII secretion target [Saccharothrix coeruleofusca]|uniref:Excreted virulence factor EspC (Type VII ESX diderm) n=1 Tax=Saccharothrix coeruleofusca TaxID=33919 RepID=A0A918EEZ8_9PSEU|nr:type VII secretion target [Saccharothrix coeruleofusca]MBP2339027.1 hypothetical protein [Saccharothrix coeruleofusca]GGP69598.1 hypothetical protein GCM10010185_48070 [Saccharothrix coeruleofusca]
MTGFEVQAEQLHKFADDQLGRQDALEAAASKADGVNLGGETFGVLLQFFADGAEEFARQTADGIRELAAAVGEAAATTKATATEYQNTETGNEQRFGGGAG